jgi:hypothetical protein
MQRLPFVLRAEYRGTEPARQFKAQDTGDNVTIPPKLRFEYEAEDGSLELLAVSRSQLDKVPGVDDVIGSLQRGDQVVLSGRAVIQDRGSDRDSYVQYVGLQAA